MRSSPQIDLTLTFLLPLVPALAVYGLFSSQNSAAFDSKAVQLGGPAALYFVLFAAAIRVVPKWRSMADPDGSFKQDLAGTWDVESVSVGSGGETAVSTAKFDLNAGELVLTGDSFIQHGRNIGSWTPDHVFLDRNRNQVLYLYDLNDVTTGANWRGLMTLTFNRAAAPMRMTGTWEVIGPSFHSGTLTFTKRQN